MKVKSRATHPILFHGWELHTYPYNTVTDWVTKRYNKSGGIRPPCVCTSNCHKPTQSRRAGQKDREGFHHYRNVIGCQGSSCLIMFSYGPYTLRENIGLRHRKRWVWSIISACPLSHSVLWIITEHHHSPFVQSVHVGDHHTPNKLHAVMVAPQYASEKLL